MFIIEVEVGGGGVQVGNVGGGMSPSGWSFFSAISCIRSQYV